MLRFAVAQDRYWLARSQGGEALELLTPALERPDAQADQALFGRALVVAASVSRISDIASAQRYGERAVEVARRLDDGRILIQALAILCSACYFAGQAERGLPLGAEAVERARPLADDILLAESLSGYLLCSDLVDPVRSGQLFDEAIACTERSGDQLFAAILHNNAGVHALRAGDVPAARAHVEAAARRRWPSGRPATTWRSTWAGCGAWTATTPARGPASRTGCGSAAAPASDSTWPTRCSAWRAWPGMRTTGREPASMHGIAQAILDLTGEPWQEPEARYRRESQAQLRAHLGAEQSDRDYARGLALGSDGIASLASRPDPQ